MSTFYIANLLDKLPQIPNTRMVHNGICVWVVWDGELDQGVPTMLEDYGGFRIADTYGQALWFFFGEEGLRALGRIHVWGKVNAMRLFMEVVPAAILVGPKFDRSLTMSVELSRQHVSPGETLEILIHPNLKQQLAHIPGITSQPAKPTMGLARVPFERLEADTALAYDPGLIWYCVLRPLGDPLSRNTAEGWRNIAEELLDIVERLGIKFTRHEGFLLFELSGLRKFRSWTRDTIARIMRLKEEGEQGHYWPSVMAAASAKGRTMGKDLPRRLGLDWDQMTPDYPHMSYRSAFLLGADFIIHEARALSRGVTVEDWCNVSLGRLEEAEESGVEPQGELAVPLPSALAGGDAKPCFYCGLNNHGARDCPSKSLTVLRPELWELFGSVDVTGLEALSQGLEAALGEDFAAESARLLAGSDAQCLFYQALFETGMPFQLRLLEIVWRSKGKTLPEGLAQAAARDGEFIWGALAALRGSDGENYEALMVQALSKYPRAYQPKSLQGFAAMEEGDWTKAVYYWQESGRLCYTALQRGYFQFLEGRAAEIQGNSHKAIAHYRETLRENPKWIEPVYRQGACLVKMGFVDQGLQYFQPLIVADPLVFNRVMLDPELERGRLQVLAALWRGWRLAQEEAKARMAALATLTESVHGRFLDGEPYLAEADVRAGELAALGKINNYVAYKQFVVGVDAFAGEVKKALDAELASMRARQDRQVEDLKGIQREAAWFPFPTLLREFNKDFNYCATRLNWMRTSSMDDAENFRKTRESMPEVDERIQTLRTRLITLRIVRDSTFFTMLFGRNFMWMEVASLGLALVLVPLLIYGFQRFGHGWVAEMVEHQKWQLQKGLVVILTISALALAAINTALTFDSKKRKLFKLAEEGKLPKKKPKAKPKPVKKTAAKEKAKAKAAPKK
ncbi:tetratricopeptide repeat protein [Solidesulfovibrio sp.]